MSVCPTCGAHVAQTETTCPGCGAIQGWRDLKPLARRPVQRPLPTTRQLAALVGAVIVVVALIWSALGGDNHRHTSAVSSTSPSSVPSTTTSTTYGYVSPLDSAAADVCRKLGSLLDDIDKGIVAPAEVRPRVKKIYDAARQSATPGIASAATELYAAVTQGGVAQNQQAVKDLTNACIQ
jgi:hypothetical protein